MDTKLVYVNKMRKASTKDQLESMSREELMEKIIQLESHNVQLKNVIRKKLEENPNIRANDETTNRKFDFSNSYKRHILLKFLYFGWDYQGFTCQEDSIDTIEHHLFNALQKTCFIESRSTSNYNRCGRTDKGVSAFGQVISIDVRSKFPESEQLQPENIGKEFNYCGILNRVLPKEIRCIAWMPLNNQAYSARFDCIQRTYRYFFPKGDLDIMKMKLSCQYLIGTYDFRNLCKMDVNNGVTNFTRNITAANIIESNTYKDKEEGFDMLYFEITGHAFLWHQIRCIMAVLFLVGQGNEDPEIIKELLDVDKNPCKPQYSPVSPIPLNLYSCEFKEKSNQERINANCSKIDLTEWTYSQDNMEKVIEDLQQAWGLWSSKTTMMREVLADLQNVFNVNFGHKLFDSQPKFLQERSRRKVYQKLLNRKRCGIKFHIISDTMETIFFSAESLENRIEHYVKKQRLLMKSDTGE